MNPTPAAYDEHDPNYDPEEHVPVEKIRRGQEQEDVEEDYYEDEDSWQPTQEKTAQFAASIRDLNKFKGAVKNAFREFLASGDSREFIRCVTELNMPLFHSEIPKAVVAVSLDQNEEHRSQSSLLLLQLWRQDIVTSAQMAQGFEKVYTSMDELVIDAPNARKLVYEFALHAVENSMLDSKLLASWRSADEQLSDATKVQALKKSVSSIVQKLLSGESDEEATISSIKELNAPFMHFYFVKKLISAALDGGNKERELASQTLVHVSGGVIDNSQIHQGIHRLLSGVEDLFLDVPDVLRLLSCFLARAVVDEVLPPAFLARGDFSNSDMATQVLEQAQVLLQAEGASMRLSSVWEELEDANQVVPRYQLFFDPKAPLSLAVLFFLRDLQADLDAVDVTKQSELPAQVREAGSTPVLLEGKSTRAGALDCVRFIAERSNVPEHWYPEDDDNFQHFLEQLSALQLNDAARPAVEKLLAQWEEGLRASKCTYLLDNSLVSVADYLAWAVVSWAAAHGITVPPTVKPWFKFIGERPAAQSL